MWNPSSFIKWKLYNEMQQLIERNFNGFIYKNFIYYSKKSDKLEFYKEKGKMNCNMCKHYNGGPCACLGWEPKMLTLDDMREMFYEDKERELKKVTNKDLPDILLKSGALDLTVSGKLELCGDVIPTTNFEKVKEFHQKMGLPHPRWLHGWSFIEVVGFRNSLILEKLAEYNKAAASGEVLEVADALADLLYVVYGTAVEHGIDIDRVFEEVHKSNMSKTPGLTDGSGKLMKGENYKAPDLNFLLESK